MVGTNLQNTAYVQQAPHTEQSLVDGSLRATGARNWTVGEYASIWYTQFANGRKDTAFATMINMSSKTVQQCRNVWDQFGGDKSDFNHALSWSHFREALPWDDANLCLEWAFDMDATVAEMKAWRRAQRGENLTQPSDEEEGGDEETDCRVPDDANGNGDDALAQQEADLPASTPALASGKGQGTGASSSPSSLGSSKPKKEGAEITPSSAIMAIRKTCKAVLLSVDPDDMDQVADELKSWERKLRPEARFVPPTLAKVAAYCKERKNSVDPKAFMTYYESVNWKVGAHKKMVSWQAAVRTWEKKSPANVYQRFEERAD